MAFAASDPDPRWSDGVIPYVLSDELSVGQRRQVQRAIDH
jgi:hypothetical protein